ncbi:MAG: hypothetical protein ACP5F3_00955 [Candidatus Syntrophosphaera sp.]
MRFSLFLLVGGLLALLLSACAVNGELRIRNRTAADIYASVDDSEPWHLEAWTNRSQLYPENKTVGISYIGDYVFPNSVSHEVRQNLVTTLDIPPDGGAIRLFNDAGDIAITEVYISPADDPGWGENDLSGMLAPADSTLWTITEGIWDVKVLDAALNAHYLYGLAVTLNQTLPLKISAFSKGGKGRGIDRKSPGNETLDKDGS